MAVVALFPGVREGPDDRHEDFEEYMTSVGLHPKTRFIYRRVVERLEAAAVESGFRLASASASQVGALMARMSTGKYGQLGQWRSAMKHYWCWKDRRDPPLRAIRVPPGPRMVNKALEPADARLLAKTARGWWPQGTAVLLGLFLARSVIDGLDYF